MDATKKNSKFSEDKFTTGPNTNFAGLDLAANLSGRVTIKPHKNGVKVL